MLYCRCEEISAKGEGPFESGTAGCSKAESNFYPVEVFAKRHRLIKSLDTGL